MEHFTPRPRPDNWESQLPVESSSWFPDSFACCMCTDVFDFETSMQQAVTLPCGHSVCRQCLVWVPNMCPSCREPFTEDANIMQPDCLLRDAMQQEKPGPLSVIQNANTRKVPPLNVPKGKLQNKARNSTPSQKWKLSDVQVSSSKPGEQAPSMATMFIRLFGDVYVDKTAEQFRAVRDAVAVLESRPAGWTAVPTPGSDETTPWQASNLSTYATRRTGTGIHGWLTNIVSNLREVRTALKENTVRLERQFENDVSTRIRDALDQQQNQDMPQATPRFESARLLKELITDMAIAALVVKEQIRTADPEGHCGGTKTAEAARIANLMAFMDAVNLPYHPLRVQYVEKLMNDMNNETASKALGRPLWEDNHKEYWGADVDPPVSNVVPPIKPKGAGVPVVPQKVVNAPLAKQKSNVATLVKQKSLKGSPDPPANQSGVQQQSSNGKENPSTIVPFVAKKVGAEKKNDPPTTTWPGVQKPGVTQKKNGRVSTTPVEIESTEEVGEEEEEEGYKNDEFEDGEGGDNTPEQENDEYSEVGDEAPDWEASIDMNDNNNDDVDDDDEDQ